MSRRRINELEALFARTRTLTIAYVKAGEEELARELLRVQQKLDLKIRGVRLASRKKK